MILILGGAFLAHIVYGAILGVITTVFIIKTGLKRSDDAGRKERAQFT